MCIASKTHRKCQQHRISLSSTGVVRALYYWEEFGKVSLDTLDYTEIIMHLVLQRRKCKYHVCLLKRVKCQAKNPKWLTSAILLQNVLCWPTRSQMLWYMYVPQTDLTFITPNIISISWTSVSKYKFLWKTLHVILHCQCIPAENCLSSQMKNVHSVVAVSQKSPQVYLMDN